MLKAFKEYILKNFKERPKEEFDKEVEELKKVLIDIGI